MNHKLIDIHIFQTMKQELTQIIKSDNFRDLVSEISEVILDSILKDGLIKDIPIFSLLIKGLNLTNTIQERLYAKKLITFLKQLENTDPEERKKEIDKIDNNPKYKTKVGEKILYLINESDDAEKANYSGILFKKFIEKKISYDDYIRCVNSINKTNIIDLNNFISENYIDSYLEKNYERYIYTGLLTQLYENPLNEYNKNSFKIIHKAQIKYKPSSIGIEIRSVLRKKNSIDL